MISYAAIEKRQARKAFKPARVSESAEQRAVVSWARLQAGAYPELALLFHIPNGRKRDGRTGAMLKREGTLAGVPDLFLPVARRVDGIPHHGLWIEMKAEKGRLSFAQGEIITKLRAQGYMVVIAFGQDEAKAAIATYLGTKL